MDARSAGGRVPEKEHIHTGTPGKQKHFRRQRNMKKRILSIALVLCVLLSITPTAFATESATVKIAGTEYTSSSDSLPTGVTIDWTNRKITLNGATITVNDTSGVVTSGIEINDTDAWTLELTESDSTVNVTAVGENPTPVCGIYCAGNLTVTGSAKLTVTAQNNAVIDMSSSMPGYVLTYAAGIYAAGTLTLSGGKIFSTVNGVSNATSAYTNMCGAVYSNGSMTISAGEISAVDNTPAGTGIRSMQNITISGGTITANATGTGSVLMGSCGVDGRKTLAISGGNVSVTDAGWGFYTNNLEVTNNATVTINGTEEGIYIVASGSSASNVKKGKIAISSANTSVTASEDAISFKGAYEGSIVAGTYSSQIPSDLIPSGYVQQNGTVIVESSVQEATAWIENTSGETLSSYTGENGGAQAIAAAQDYNHIYLTVPTTATNTSRSVGDKITVWVKDGVSFNGNNLSFTGEGVEGKCVAGVSKTVDGVTYHSYIYTMYVTESAAALKLMRGNEVVGYYSGFDKFSHGAMADAQDGDTIVMLKDLDLGTSEASIDKTITLDLAGHTISGSDNNVVDVNSSFVLTINDSSTEKTGKIQNTGNNRTAVFGNVIINDGTFEGKNAIRVNEGYNAIINGGTFIGEIFLNGTSSSVEIYGGNFGQSGFAPSSKGSVLVSGTTISGYCGDGENDTDVIWKVEPTTGTVTLNGKTLTNLKLTLSGNGTMKDYANSDYNNAPWYGMREQITEVVVGCADLGDYAMKQMNKVTSLTLSEGLTSIGNYAFQNTPINGVLTVPASVTSIGDNVFENCGVSSFAVAGGSSFVAEDGVLLNNNKTTIVAYPDGAAQFVAYTAPSTVTSITPGAFSGSEVKSIALAENTTLTGQYWLPTFADANGYSFKGWYSDNAYTTSITHLTSGTAFAKWVSTVTFDANGGTLENNVYSVAHDTVIGELPTPTPADNTKSFLSWNTEADGTGTRITATTKPAGHVTYYAIWGTTIDNITLINVPDQTYTGSAITPTIQYKIGDTTYTATDVDYTNNTNVGTATATFTVENVTDPVSVTFRIVVAAADMSGVNFENAAVTYDGQAHSLAISGALPAGVSVSYTATKGENPVDVDNMKDAGTYTVTASFTDSTGNYDDIDSMTATLTINKASLTITADDQSMYVGGTVPTLTYTVTGLIAGETLTTEPTASCSALGDTVGNFAIRISGAVASSNYRSNITYVDGVLSVVNRPTYSGGGSYTPSYSITPDKAENGSIKVSSSNAAVGSTVTITVDPDKGYVLETLTVLDKNGKEIELTKKADDKYTFKMPSGKVTVTATFMEDNTMLNYFVDVFATDYYYDAVLWAVENGITNGTSATSFSPDAPCTRAQMATFLWRAAGSPDPAGASNPFTDIPADAYYAKAVQWAYEKGITGGTTATTFSPDATCTRGQMATFLWRNDGSLTPTDSTTPFADVLETTYYATAVQWAYEQKITSGTSTTTFSPDDPCTRAQMVTFLYRYFEN